MKKLGIISVILFLLLICFIIYTLASTGFWRTIADPYEGKVYTQFSIPGAEDMTVLEEEDFIVISSDDRRSNEQGGIYIQDLRKVKVKPINISEKFKKPFHPHGISLYKLDSLGYILYVINHVEEVENGNVVKRHYIEKFQLHGYDLKHLETIKHPKISSPNDIVAIDENQFYFTNDHGFTSKWGILVEDYLGLAKGNVVYFDGQNYDEKASKIAYANGINYDTERKLLFVASPRRFLIKVFQVGDNMDLTFIENIDCGTGVDNIEFDQNKKLWIGCHPDLITFGEYAKGKVDYSPSEIITIDYRKKGDFDIKTIFMDNGKRISACTVAIPYKEFIYVGNVMANQFVVLSTKTKFKGKK